MAKTGSLQKIFDSFEKVNALIIGDVMVDAYFWGNVERISPEAPVPVVSIVKKENRLGGAANVAMNIQALGATPILCSVIGNDASGRMFTGLLQELNMPSDGMVLSEERPTTVKTRIIGNNHQMLRVDEEQEGEISVQERKALLKRIEQIIGSKKIDVIIFEDYDKGVISKLLIEQVIKLAGKNKIPVTVDPKRKNFNHYRHVTLLKPNLKELREGMKIDLEKNDLENIREAVAKLCTDHSIGMTLVTLSDKGIYLKNGKTDKLIPAHVRNIADVSGAGDTVISVASLCLAVKTSAEFMATLANLAGGLVCEKVGVVPVDKQLLFEEANKLK